MEERRFQVLEQTSPSRCEVCHQADQFDAFTATCMRCQALILAHSLPEEQAARYQQFQQVARPRDTNVPTSDLFRIMPEAFKLYSRNFGLFLKVCLAGQGLIILLSLVPTILLFLGAGMVSPGNIALVGLAMLFLILGASLVLWPIMSGALTKAILDRYRGENASVVDSYKFIFQRGWKYISTAIMGHLYQSVGFLLCFVGGIYTFPRGLFVPEVAIIEEKYSGDALNRSSKLATTNIGIPLLFGLIWVVGVPFIQIVVKLMFVFSLLLVLPQTVAELIGQLVSSLAGLVILPLLFTTKLLMYFHLRMRTDEVLFIGDEPKKSMYPMPQE